MSNLKVEIMKLAETTLLLNKEIAKIVGCSEKTVRRYAGTNLKRIQKKSDINNEDIWHVKKSILLPDLHYPHHDKKAMRSINDFIIDYQPDEILYMGDQLDLSCISSWNKKRPLLKEGKRLIDEYKNFNEEILLVHEKITRDDCKRVFFYGNHERRIQWYIQEHPELDGFLDIDTSLQLKERGYKIIEYNDFYNIEKLRVIHGFYYNKYHAAKTLDVFEKNVVYGHAHNPQSYTKISPMDIEGYHTATSLGCLCNISPEYMEGKPNFWSNGFGIVESSSYTKYFNLYPITIINGTFLFNGKIYKGR